MTKPVRESRVIIERNDDPGYTNRLMVGTACTGLLRVEWYAARTSQVTPLNWSATDQLQMISGYMPLKYLVDDAQNLIVAKAIELDMEWLFLLEHDVVIPRDTFVQLNRYLKDPTYPIVSGLYFSRAFPSEPMVFRGWGNGCFTDWKLGDLVFCSGVPTGCLLIHVSVLKAMWEDSEEYVLGGKTIRRIFNTPRSSWYNHQTNMTNFSIGTSDLEWCRRVIDGDYLARAGWAQSWPDGFPFLVDTRLFCQHINPDGTMYPDPESLKEFLNA